ncbi:MAG: hypothetical protein MJ093_05105 [Saccharofermentans sp.]|nr:hypothetical protein [Saccharofermentans sp.]
MENEKAYVPFVSGLLSFILFLALIVCVNSFNIYQYMLDTHSIVKAIDTKSLVKDLKKEITEEGGSEFERFDDYEELFDDVFSQEFVDYYLESTLDASLFGETDYDSDDMYDLIDEASEDFFDEHDEISKEDREKFINDLVEAADEGIEQTLDNSVGNEFAEAIQRVDKIVEMILLCSFVAALLMAGLLFIIYQNKGRPFISIGRAAIIAMMLSAAGMIFIKFLVAEASKDVSGEETFIAEAFNNFVDSVFTKSIVLAGVVFVIGIAFVVIGLTWSKIAHREDDDDYYDSRYEDLE